MAFIRWSTGGRQATINRDISLLSVPHIMFLIFRQSSMPQHLSLLTVITFLNDKFSALKLQFLKILPHYAKDDTFKKSFEAY